MAGLAPLAPEKDAKSKLAYFLQKYTGQNMARSSIDYKSEKIEVGDSTVRYQSTVTLLCVEDEPAYAGEPADLRKDAEQKAAQQALDAFANEVNELVENKDAFKGREKRKAVDATGMEPAAKQSKMAFGKQLVGNFPGKSKLMELLSKSLKRSIAKTDAIFETAQVGDEKQKKYQTTLSLPCLPERSEETWIGELKASIKEAEHSAADKCCEELMSDPNFATVAFKLHAKSGMAKMLGSGVDLHDMYTQMMNMAKGKGYDLKGMMKGKGKGASFDPKRTRLSEEVMTGTVIEVKNNHAFIEADNWPIEGCEKKQNKIYFSFADCQGEEGTQKPEWMMEGSTVGFKAYTDGRGLGGEEIVKL